MGLVFRFVVRFRPLRFRVRVRVRVMVRVRYIPCTA